MMQKFNINKLLREPLLHFLVIGAGLFFLFSQVGDPDIAIDNRIVITQADLDRLADVWLRRTGRPPTSQDRERQLEHFIREQVLYREALAMGLDKDDVIVRRRLSQKMEYLFNDLSLIVEPSEAELNAFLTENFSKFTVPAKISFRHIYLDPGSRGQGVYEDAKKLLTQLHDPAGVTDVTSKGDRSLLPYDYSEEREKQLAGLFGKSFAAQLFALPAGSWQAPITSEYGVHLVYVKSHIKSRLPQLAEIRERVSSEWQAEKQREANEVFYQSLRQRYEIVLDDNIVKDAMVSAEQ
ncbi:MAG: peptidyl-prolyl cis-trans isomerase [Deltaproteobacteria bacterium]|nr:peptidyl-prolyl cis-trans isomerase [Deltaproteobacteria bacterium]